MFTSSIGSDLLSRLLNRLQFSFTTATASGPACHHKINDRLRDLRREERAVDVEAEGEARRAAQAIAYAEANGLTVD